MIRHCVFIRFKRDTSDTVKTALYQDIRNLQSRLPGIVAIHAGSNVSPEAGMDKHYSDGFILDFADAAARDAYLANEEHQAIGARLVEAAAGGLDGIFVFDLNCT